MAQMVVPYPIQPGGKWIVRLNLNKDGCWTQGRGRAPKGAALDDMPSVMNPSLNALVARDSSIVYGERIFFPNR
jgi:hypothetical protein